MRKGNKSTVLRILSYLKPYKKELMVTSITLISSTVLGFLQPLVIRIITDDGISKKNMIVLVHAVLVLAGIVLLNQVIDLIQTRIFADIHNDSYGSIFRQVFQKLLHLRKCYFEDKNDAEILSFLQLDVSQVSSVTGRYTVMCISHIFRIISGLIGLFIISWKLALIVLAMVPIKFLLVRRMSRQREKTTEEMIESSRDFSRWFSDSINGIDEIKLWDLFQSKERTFLIKQENVLRLEKAGAMIDAWNIFGEMLLEWSVTLLLYLFGGAMICSGNMTIGVMFAFVSYSGYITGPIAALINLKMYFARIIPSAKRMFQFLNMEVEKNEGTQYIEKTTPKLEFQKVSFCYEKERPILSDVSFYVNPGEKIAVIGQNGSGKSTILNLLLRFYEPQDGEILANGKRVQTIDLKEYRRLFSVVSQEPYLFFGSIAENVNLSGEVAVEDIDRAMKMSGVLEYVNRMPEKDKTSIGFNGARLSGGEKQKLAVARALIKDAPIVILDEATSGFDVESDAYLHDIIVSQMKDKSVIMITHHLEHLEGMDRVYRLENGKLICVYKTRKNDNEMESEPFRKDYGKMDG